MRDAEPCERKGGSKQPRRLPKGRAAPRVHREEHDEQQEYERVCSIERHLAGEQQRVEEKEGHHAPAVLVVVMQERVDHIGERRDMYPRVPDHRVIIVVAVQRHKIIEREHQGENEERREHRPHCISIHAILSLGEYARKFAICAPFTASAAATSGAQTAASSASKS